MKRTLALLALAVLAGCSSGPAPAPSEDVASANSPAPKDTRLTLNFQRADLKTVFDLIARSTGLNIILEKGASGRLTMSTNNLPAGDILEAVAKTFDLKLVYAPGNIVRVSP